MHAEEHRRTSHLNPSRHPLNIAVQNWPTISVNESKNSVGKSQEHRNSIPLGTMAAMQDAANWSTPESHPRTHTPRNVGAGTYRGKEPLANQVAELHGQAAPASSSSLGSRQGLWLTPRANEPDSDPNFAARNADRGAHCHGTLSSQAKETWWTPQVQDSKHSGTNPTANGERDLLVNQVNWMTPRACEAQNPPMGVDKRHHGLTHQVTKQWATPKTPTGGPETAKRKQELGRTTSGGGDLASQTLEQWGSPRTGIRADTHFSYDRGKHNIEGQAGASMKGGGKLNPRWVETLMGLPIGWTMPSCTSPQTIAPMSCGSSAMELSQPPQSELSEFSLAS
jgi:hypothetical protein